MKQLRSLFLAVCAIAFSIPVYGQKDTLTKDGLYLEYNLPFYRSDPLKLMEAMNQNKELDSPADEDMIRGILDRATKAIGLKYKALPQYIISEQFGLCYPPANPKELLWTTGNSIDSQWIHEDGECILFLKCSGDKPSINGKVPEADRTKYKLPEEYLYGWIKPSVNVEPMSLKKVTEEEKEEIKKKITFWTPEKAKEVFNAQYVITYPIKSKKSVYMGKYTHKMDLMMIKWEEHLTVSFLLTKKGYKQIDKYLKEVEEAFRFED